ncbi:hypothetical protein HanHA89_Chr05g0204341 [Helianthus annuus]|nr:hypothetical protein HanHA89_Chr05g0204341 [Helianthus annuus]
MFLKIWRPSSTKPEWLQACNTTSMVMSSGFEPSFCVFSIHWKTFKASLPRPCFAKPEIMVVHETVLFNGIRLNNAYASSITPQPAYMCKSALFTRTVRFLFVMCQFLST